MSDQKENPNSVVDEQKWAEILERIERGDTSVTTEVMWIQNLSGPKPKEKKKKEAERGAENETAAPGAADLVTE